MLLGVHHIRPAAIKNSVPLLPLLPPLTLEAAEKLPPLTLLLLLAILPLEAATLLLLLLSLGTAMKLLRSCCQEAAELASELRFAAAALGSCHEAAEDVELPLKHLLLGGCHALV